LRRAFRFRCTRRPPLSRLSRLSRLSLVRPQYPPDAAINQGAPPRAAQTLQGCGEEPPADAALLRRARLRGVLLRAPDARWSAAPTAASAATAAADPAAASAAAAASTAAPASAAAAASAAAPAAPASAAAAANTGAATSASAPTTSACASAPASASARATTPTGSGPGRPSAAADRSSRRSAPAARPRPAHRVGRSDRSRTDRRHAGRQRLRDQWRLGDDALRRLRCSVGHGRNHPEPTSPAPRSLEEVDLPGRAQVAHACDVHPQARAGRGCRVHSLPHRP
jgi:hypothetical protein